MMLIVGSYSDRGLWNLVAFWIKCDQSIGEYEGKAHETVSVQACSPP